MAHLNKTREKERERESAVLSERHERSAGLKYPYDWSLYGVAIDDVHYQGITDFRMLKMTYQNQAFQRAV